MKKITKVTMLSVALLGSIGFTSLASADNTVAGRADVKFKSADPSTPVDPVDPEDPDPKPIEPVDPTDPKPPIYPGGALRLNHVPTISFGVNSISAKTASYPAKLEKVIDIASQSEAEKASFVEVADETGDLKGWTVSVTSDGVFKPTKGIAQDAILAAITLTDAEVRGLNGMATQLDKAPTATNKVVIGHSAPAQSAEILKAEAGKGYNKWQVRYGHSKDAIVSQDDQTKRNNSVSLTVPEGQAVMAEEEYSATVTWTLTQGL